MDDDETLRVALLFHDDETLIVALLFQVQQERREPQAGQEQQDQ